MGKMSPASAAKAWKISRTVIYERMKKGELSYTKDASGKRQIDSSEMLRVFGEPNAKEHPPVFESVNPPPSTDSSALIDALKDQISTLKSQTETLSEQLKVKDAQLTQRDDQVQSLIEQLSDMSQRLLPSPVEDEYEEDVPAPEPIKRKWWQLRRKKETTEV